VRKIGAQPVDRIDRARAPRARPNQGKEFSMLRKLAVALVAASAFTAPALAQGTAPKTDKPAAAATTTAPKTQTKPTLDSAKVRKHHRHVAHLRHYKHAKYVKTERSLHSAKHEARPIGNAPAPTVGSAPMSTTKPKSGTN
jgi:hypothetical protein